MKRIALLCGIATALVASCSVEEKDFQAPGQENERFYATIEQPGGEGTRVYATEDLLLRWTADDRVSIFNKSTYNQQYKFTGETGDNAGGFRKVATDEFVTGNSISDVVSVYPYQEGTKISESEVITVTLPAEQHYAEKTFGLGANTMVSVTEDNFLQYKNVGGYLLLKLYGDGVSVSSITLKGNKGEKLAGKATVTMPVGGEPSVVMSGDATTEITLTCETPVQLGSSAEESTQFWLVVPPMTFERGFTVTVTGTGGVYEKSTSKTVTLERNNLFKMSPLEVKFSQPKNVIYYTSLDGSIVTPDSQSASPDAFGVNILSNEYINGQGIITFDGDVTSIGDFAFRFCFGLTSITLPNSVTSIGAYVFDGCESLTSITLPDSVTSIGQGAFRNCYSLASITIPDSVTSIGERAFYYCESLASITIPDSVTSIGAYVFDGCESLTSITLPDSVTSIGDSAFGHCSSLTSITIPDSVTSIGSGAFSGCSSLTSITIPESVTSIGDGVFSRCSSLMSFTGKFASEDGLLLINQGEVIAVALGKINGSITIPSNVTRIGSSSFSGCSALNTIIIPDSVTSIGEYAFEGCENLTTINIPDNITCIEEGTFYRCSNLSHIIIPDGVTSIEKSSFTFCSSLTSIIIPESVTRIGGYAFSRCSGLTSITIPESVTSIGEYAFNRCNSLTNITLPSGLTSIERFLFYECSSLTSITIPESVTSIGRGAFQNCISLSSIIVLPVIPPAGGKEMFSSTNDAPIYVPASSVEEYMFTEFWIDYADRIQALAPLPEAIDLGLPSGIKWASFNLGATKPEEYGNYYAWGETKPYYNCQDPLIWDEGKEAGYYWNSYKWSSGESYSMTKYCTVSQYGNGFTDGKTVLDPEDDAVHVNLGGNWRMPTDAEWTELRENCTWTWMTRNGVNGTLVTANNGNSIFLPAASCRIMTSISGVGFEGWYWSSSLVTGCPCDAWRVIFNSDGVEGFSNFRYIGLSIRPVSE